MEVVKLDLGANSYEIHIAPGLLNDAELLRSRIRGQKVFVVTCETVASLYLEKLEQVLQGFHVDCIRLPDGEQPKTLGSLELIIDALLSAKHNRSTTIIALGGGVIGDIAGFAAATYQRGVDYIQVPTTLLAQVDSSVGGKTAVNHQLGKNMIGAFYQPRAVYIDTNSLNTLPVRELSAGLAEVIKYGILADVNFFSWLEDHVDELLTCEDSAIGFAVKRCCEIKAEIVAIDEKEEGGRAFLNLGHTFGHAIEASEGYGSWLHGEAVATGMVLAADLSRRMGKIESADALRVKNLIRRCGLPVKPPEKLEASQFIELMKVDKKATDAGIRFVLIEDIGRVDLFEDVDSAILLETLAAGDQLCETD